MISFPNAKINLGLYITDLRPDGYHNLETIFYPIRLEDALEVIPSSQAKGIYTYHGYGNEVAGSIEQNLVVKAYQLLHSDFELPSVDIYLYKHIPLGSGLGGGSADAAFMLCMLNELFELNLSDADLSSFAVRLGADCPFFLLNKPAFAQGIGEILTPIPLTLDDYQILVVKPDIFVSTKEAFAHVPMHKPEHILTDIAHVPVSEWKTILYNDFEKSVFPQHAELAQIKAELYQQGALYASMSGSGSAVYGIFGKDKLLDLSPFKKMFCYLSPPIRR